MLDWNSSANATFHPLIQQKKMYTGKGEGSFSRFMLQYRGLPFSNRTYGILNATGSEEGVVFAHEQESTQLIYDTVLARSIMAQYTGKFKADGPQCTSSNI